MTKSILLIEQDDNVRELITYILEERGWHVQAAQQPFHPAQTIKQPDLILIDEWVSGHAGARLCNLIKRHEQWGAVPVLIISTAPHIETIVKECGADDFIRKPFDIDELVEKVQVYLTAPPAIYGQNSNLGLT